MLKSSMLQRQLKLNAYQIQEEEYLVREFKVHLKHYKSLAAGYGIKETRRKLQWCRRSIKQLAELQVFLKGQLQRAYDEEHSMRWFKYAPLFMGEAPKVGMGSYSIEINGD